MRVFGVVGHSNSGKTTLIESLLPRLVERGLVVSVIKHTHHAFDVDRPGKDSWRHRQAGASAVLLTCDHRWALLRELRGAPEPPLEDQVRLLQPCDLVLVEGFKSAPIPKLEVHRPSRGIAPLWPHDPTIVAVATDDPSQLGSCPRAVLSLADPEAIAELILAQ